ncbi:MAG TPA: 5'-methylthioadenosine phosphorylase [Acidimicrobiia bacterium]
MGRLAVIGKLQTLGPPPAPARDARAATALYDHGTHVTLYRHGVETYVPPHATDAAAHLRALRDVGCDRVLGVSSVGSLRVDLAVGSFVIPDDFLALAQPPIVADVERQHVVPGFTPDWRARLLDVWRDVAAAPVVDGGVYWQSNGPRFETRAEVRLAAAHADLVGMTLASECVAANQVGLAYAGVCVVDNLANGIGGTPLTVEAYEHGAAANAARLQASLDRIVPVLAR